VKKVRGNGPSIVIQDRSRLYRETLQFLIEASSSDRAEVVATEEALRESCFVNPGIAVIFEASGVPWDIGALVDRLRGSMTEPVLVGTYPHEPHFQQTFVGVAYVARTASSSMFLRALRHEVGTGIGHVLPLEAALSVERAPDSLTQRELQILALISGGLTKAEIGERLKMSPKAVENRKQALFAKLGVQNQSHAVAVAMRTGLLGGGPIHLEIRESCG